MSTPKEVMIEMTTEHSTNANGGAEPASTSKVCKAVTISCIVFPWVGLVALACITAFLFTPKSHPTLTVNQFNSNFEATSRSGTRYEYDHNNKEYQFNSSTGLSLVSTKTKDGFRVCLVNKVQACLYNTSTVETMEFSIVGDASTAVQWNSSSEAPDCYEWIAAALDVNDFFSQVRNMSSELKKHGYTSESNPETRFIHTLADFSDEAEDSEGTHVRGRSMKVQWSWKKFWKVVEVVVKVAVIICEAVC